MSEEYKISDALADVNHPAHDAANSILAKLKSGEINMCGCLGPMYGEPHCPCQMRNLGLGHIMDANPIRKKAEEEARISWQKANEPGGFFYEMYRENQERADNEHRS